jgi:hypothetical protein
LESDAVLIMTDQWHEVVQEAEMGNIAGVKVNKQNHP